MTCILFVVFILLSTSVVATSEQLEDEPQIIVSTEAATIAEPTEAPTSWIPNRYSLINRLKLVVSERMENSASLLRKFEAFKQYLINFHKNYDIAQIPMRFSSFLKHLELLNTKGSEDSSFIMGINKYFDWNDAELKHLSGLKLNVFNDSLPQMIGRNSWYNNNYNYDNRRLRRRDFDSRQANPSVTSKDWRDTNCVQPVRDQKDCGSCYAFSVLGVVETMLCLKAGIKNIDLAPQQLVDCAREHKNYGCDGGWPTRVFSYLNNVGYVSKESCYPYKNKEKTCSLKSSNTIAGSCKIAVPNRSKMLRYREVSGQSQMLSYLTNNGPLIGVIEITEKFVFYKKGVFKNSACKRYDNADHAIIIAGFGEDNGQKYWLVKNSWGADWGENGYARVQRGTNMCSIEEIAWAVTEV